MLVRDQRLPLTSDQVTVTVNWTPALPMGARPSTATAPVAMEHTHVAVVLSCAGFSSVGVVGATVWVRGLLARLRVAFWGAVRFAETPALPGAAETLIPAIGALPRLHTVPTINTGSPCFILAANRQLIVASSGNHRAGHT